MHNLMTIIETAFENRSQLNTENIAPEIKQAIFSTIDLLDTGKIRVAEKKNNEWITHEWIKKAILLFMKIAENNVLTAGDMHFFDKVPLKFSQYAKKEFSSAGMRVVPPAMVRKGAYIAANTIIMPAFVNIGAYIDSGTMIDTWATVGSCAQIGKNVHISGGAGIGGVLEPLQAKPTIIEDNCFIGARSEIVEGVIVEENAVISMGVFIGQSTPIYNRMTQKITHGRIPAGAVVIAGSLPSKDGHYSSNAAIIIKQVDAKTRGKVALNELLRID